MANRRHFGPKPPPEQSPKDHVNNPPRKITAHGLGPARRRQVIGQFTGIVDPGIEKK